MRLTRFTFAVLALMSVFTACTKEEMPTPQAEVAGAKLLGKNLSAEFPIASETKTDADGNWVAGDKLGLAWVTETNTISANHLFQMGTDGLFTTYGNVYEGVHFAYYPYAYMPSVGAKSVTINPKQTETIDKDIFATRLHLSTKQGLTAAHNLDGDKLVNGNFKMRRAVKALNVTLNVDENITSSDALKGLKIKKVTLSAGNNELFFGGNVALNPNALASPVYVNEAGKVVPSTDIKNCNEPSHNHTLGAPAAVYPAGATFSEAETAKEFYKSLLGDGKVFGTPAYTKSLETEVDNNSINLSANQNIRFYTLPKAVADTANLRTALKVRVDVQNGYFEIAFKEKDGSTPLTAAQVANNNALKVLAGLYATPASGIPNYLAGFSADNEEFVGHADGLVFTLDASMFEQSFGDITSEADWNAAVAMVDALGIKNPIFTIKHGTNPWKFEDEDNNGALINLPAASDVVLKVGKQVGSAVECGTLYLNKENANMPETSNKFVIETNVVVEKDLNVAGKFEVAAGKTIKNNATIYAGAAADIKSLNNAGKRVVAAYGAKVDNDSDDNKGTVAYVVNAVSQDDYAKVSTMLTEDAIAVNTLVIDAVAFDLNAKSVATSGNGYGGAKTEYLNEKNILVGIAFELVNGGSLTANNTDMDADKRKYDVKSVVAKSGNTAVTDINILESLKVEAGEMTATDASFTNTNTDPVTYANIEVAKDAKLTIASAKFNTLTRVYDLKVDGTVNVNINGLTTDKVIVSADGNLNITGYNYLVWASQSELKGTTSGVIAQGAKDYTTLSALITLAKAGDVVYLAGDIKNAGNININDKVITFNLNSNTLYGSITSKKDLVVKNGKVENTDSNYSGIEVQGSAKLNLENVNVKSAKHAVRSKSSGAVVINGGTYEVIPGLDSQFAVNAGDEDDLTYTADVTIKGGVFKGPGTATTTTGSPVQVQGKAIMTIEGGEFSGAKEQPLLYVDPFAPATTTFVCKGGKYEGFNPTSYLATGCESKEITSGTYNGWFEVK